MDLLVIPLAALVFSIIVEKVGEWRGWWRDR